MDKRLKPSKAPKKKYKLKALLDNCTHLEREKAMEELPELIGKCRNTLINYIKTPYESKTAIPYEAGIAIEKYFRIRHGSLSNIKIKV